ncbi:MAG: hypothetical protein ACI4OR_04735 [Alphaproteobacteria bacterium]
MLVEETIYENENIRMFVEKEDDKPSLEERTCQCGRAVCRGKHKGGCPNDNKIRFIKRERGRS